jgi:tetratricopeptide (TPR) repeat protein
MNEKELIMIRAAHHAKHEEFDLALSCIQMILDEDPDDSVAWFNKGYTLHLSGKLDEARDLFLELNEQYPEKTDVCFELSLLAIDTGNHDEAEEYLNKCITLEPLSPQPRIELARMLYEAGDYERSKEIFTEALVFDPENGLIRMYLGLISVHLKKPDEAERWYLESLDHDPDNTEILFHCARLYEELGRRDDEIKCYNRLIEIDPEQIIPWLKKGMIYLIADDLSKAVLSFRMAARLDTESHLPHLLLGLVYNTLDRHEDAITSLEKAVALSPEPDILLQYGRVLGSSFQYKRALEIFDSVLQVRPDDSTAAEGYARTLYHLHRWEDLISFCEERREENSDNPFWVTTIARTLGWYKDDPDMGITILKDWADAHVGTQAYLVLADLLVHIGRYDDARSLVVFGT